MTLQTMIYVLKSAFDSFPFFATLCAQDTSNDAEYVPLELNEDGKYFSSLYEIHLFFYISFYVWQIGNLKEHKSKSQLFAESKWFFF